MIEILVHNLLSCELGLGKLISHSGHSFSLGTGPVCHWQMYLNDLHMGFSSSLAIQMK